MGQISKIIYKLECELANYSRENKTINLNEIFDEKFIEFGVSGKIYNRELVIKELENGRAKRDIKISGFKAEALTEAIWLVTYTATSECDDGSETITLRSSLWKDTGGALQILFHQGTNKIRI